MKNSLIVITLILLTACVASPENLKLRFIEEGFQQYRGVKSKHSSKVKVEKVDSLESPKLYSEQYLDEKKVIVSKGYKKIKYFVSFNTDPYCIDFYDVYEKCDSGRCTYNFILAIDLCQ